ncbi:uncharacterized protein LOC130998906 [Salvia miltiorrhiza]|uniref:uncharacterized protein LOC130998906 n=1 Tax=Salvia miltiorrhiza TaxID=226208 RepID=UPI0025AD69A0|nr:uncharacterized protein LOC130998906 [Salvia miltiorrhiza]
MGAVLSAISFKPLSISLFILLILSSKIRKTNAAHLFLFLTTHSHTIHHLSLILTRSPLPSALSFHHVSGSLFSLQDLPPPPALTSARIAGSDASLTHRLLLLASTSISLALSAAGPRRSSHHHRGVPPSPGRRLLPHPRGRSAAVGLPGVAAGWPAIDGQQLAGGAPPPAAAVGSKSPAAASPGAAVAVSRRIRCEEPSTVSQRSETTAGSPPPLRRRRRATAAAASL